MKTTSQCPFCGSAITFAQLRELREKIAKGQDPTILREMESIQDSIRTDEQKKASVEVKAIRTKLEQYQKRERELDKRDADIKAREITIESDVRKQVAKREKTIREQVVLEMSEKQKYELADREVLQAYREGNRSPRSGGRAPFAREGETRQATGERASPKIIRAIADED